MSKKTFFNVFYFICENTQRGKKKLNQEFSKLKWGWIQNKNCYSPPHQLKKQEDAIEDKCMEHSHVRVWNLDNWRRRLEAFEMSCYRRMRNIKWMDEITNEEVLWRIEEKRTLWKSLKKRRGWMMGHTHTLRHGGWLRGGDILEGEVGKKRENSTK